MSNPFIGEIRIFGGNFPPLDWALCDGQLMSIAENSALFQLIGTTYGGDGQSTFALPDLRGRVPIHLGPGFVQAQSGGVENVTLTMAQMRAHNHSQVATTATATPAAAPSGNLVAASAATKFYGAAPSTPMAATAILPAGQGQPHDNMAPFLVVNFIISLFGIFPSQP